MKPVGFVPSNKSSPSPCIATDLVLATLDGFIFQTPRFWFWRNCRFTNDYRWLSRRQSFRKLIQVAWQFRQRGPNPSRILSDLLRWYSLHRQWFVMDCAS
jgi:hypothetical protein